MIDSISQLAMAAYSALQPYWPYFAQKASEEITEAAESAPEAFGNLFGVIHGHSEKHEAASAAISDLLANPEDAQRQSEFQARLKELLKHDPEFANRLRAALSELPDPSTPVRTKSGSDERTT
jgi:hypothetical protein